MSRSRQQQKSKPALLGNHQKCWIWGRITVLETLQSGRWPILELRLAERLPHDQIEQVRSLAERHSVPVSVEPAGRLTRLCRTAEHQGYAAKMTPFPYDTADQILKVTPERPLYVLLDGIHDPYNFGAIIRTAVAMAVDALFVPTRRQCDVTSLVARSSAGAVNRARIAQVDSLRELAGRLGTMGVTVAGADPGGGCSLSDCRLSQPLAVVIGNEAAGIDRDLLELCDLRVSIPQYGNVESLNAAVAAGILLYEVRRQRAASE